jgi:Bacteriophage Mu Gam like protein
VEIGGLVVSMNSLQKMELLDIEEIQSQEKFEITDRSSLNWAFRKLVALRSEEQDIKQLAEKERKRITEWEKTELSSITNSIDFFESLIAAYHAKQLEADPQAKTLSTPYGKSKTRKSSEAPEKENEEELLRFITDNGMNDFIKSSVKWGDFKKSLTIAEIDGQKVAVSEDGQLVPGIVIKPESISYSVVINE